MSDEHKAAIASGRAEGAAVRRYLETLEAKRQPGRRVSAEELEGRLAKTIEEINSEEDQLKLLDLIQQRIDLEERIDAAEAEDESLEAEEEFVALAKGYAERKGISYTAFRQMGVPASVLKAAGMKQERGRGSQS